MPATVTCISLSHATPEGRPLFSNITLQFGPQRTGLVGRNGVGKSTLLRLLDGALAPDGGQVAVEGRIRRLDQSPQLPEGAVIADLFGARAALDLLDRAAQGAASIDELAEADWSLPERIAAGVQRFGLDADPRRPLAALSGGQRTRAALAALVFDAPDMLLLDEPTNNLDADGRSSSCWPAGGVEPSSPAMIAICWSIWIELSSSPVSARRAMAAAIPAIGR